jgi:hypothetical protein
MSETADLLEEISALKAMLTAADARDKRKDERIARLEKLVATFRQAVFGRRSEKSDPDQFELALEDLETAMAVIHAEEDAEDRVARRPAKPRAANRGSLPKHLPRIEEVIEPESLICACGGCLHCIGEVEEDQETVRGTASPTTVGAARHRARPVPRDRDPPCQICLPVLHRWGCAGARPGPADPGRDADRGDSGACAGQQVRRPPSASVIGRVWSMAMSVQRAGPCFCPWSARRHKMRTVEVGMLLNSTSASIEPWVNAS